MIRQVYSVWIAFPAPQWILEKLDFFQLILNTAKCLINRVNEGLTNFLVSFAAMKAENQHYLATDVTYHISSFEGIPCV